LLTKFLRSRRQGISPRTIDFYKFCLTPFVNGYQLTSESINLFLSELKCGNAKHAYYRSLRAFCTWANREGYIQDNPIKKVDAPYVKERILPSLTTEQVKYLIDRAESIHDKCVISLFADSGMRLSELASLTAHDINWKDNTITIIGKGNKQRKAPFTKRTETLLKKVVSDNRKGSGIWQLEPRGIEIMLKKLGDETGLICNPHTFRRTFASNLHRAGMDIEHIMRLGGWSSLDMVLTYTKSVKFEDSLKLYRELET
jgi:integrase/recombinase XerD